MAENRKSRRPILIASVGIQLPDRGPKLEGLSLDVSPGGMRIYSPKPLRMGICIILEITFEASHGKQVTETLSALVKWCKPERGMYAAGIEFKGLDTDLHPRLITFLEQTEPCRETIHDTKGYDQPGRDSH